VDRPNFRPQGFAASSRAASVRPPALPTVADSGHAGRGREVLILKRHALDTPPKLPTQQPKMFTK